MKRAAIFSGNCGLVVLTLLATASAADTPNGQKAAAWQSGCVEIDGRWVKLDGIPAALDAGLLDEYRRMREQTPDTVEGQLKLAAWCRRKGQLERERAHLTAVLARKPDHAFARSRLGYRRVGRIWVSRKEIEAANRTARETMANLKRWTPRLTSIRDGLLSDSQKLRAGAEQRLKAIADPAAVPAIEAVLARHSEPLAKRAVETLARMNSKDADLALAEQAVFSPWEPVRRAAVENLAGRRLDNFVPALLALMHTPVESAYALYVGRNGNLLYRHVFFREGQKVKKLAVADMKPRTVVQAVRRDPRPGSRPAGPGLRLSAAVRSRLDRGMVLSAAVRTRLDAIRTAKDVARQRENIASRQRAAEVETNERVAAVLSKVAGGELNTDPRHWWQWWLAHSGLWTDGEKPLCIQHLCEELPTPEPVVIPSQTMMSCLAAGTPVWTERGLIAVEKVQIGDLVPAKNVETGEVALKPVLDTTIRPPTKQLRIEIGPRTISATEGHQFWVSGRGWLRARELQTGMQMHDAVGTTPVGPISEGETQPAYNLVVADFHTYFVGETAALSHDNTPAAPTDKLVPGQ